MTPTPQARLRDAVALTIAYFFPVAMAYIYFVAYADPESTRDMAGIVSVLFSVGKSIQFLLPIGYVFCFDRDKIRLAWPTLRGILLGVGFAMVVGAAMLLLWFGGLKDIAGVAEDTPGRIHEKVVLFRADSPGRFLLLASAISVVHALAEEYYWRWFVFGWMRRHMPLALAIVLSGVGFMLHHIVILGVYFPWHFWTLALPFSIGVGIGGAFWAWLYARSESLYAPWLSHCLVDAAIMAIGYSMLVSRYWS